MARGSRGRARPPPRSITTRGSTPVIPEEVIQPLHVATQDLLAPTPPQPSPTEHTQGGDQGATSEEPVEAAPKRRPRGPTTRSCETSVAAGNPRPIVELDDGCPVGVNVNIFKSTVYSWVKTPTVLNQGVQGFSKLSHNELSNFWNRVNDCFEFVEIIIDKASTSIVPPPTTTSATSTSISGSSSTGSTPTQRPAHPDPMDCLPLHEKTKIALRNLIAATYNQYRYDIRKKHFDVYTTQEERLANPPIGWPISQWTEILGHWGAEHYENKRRQASINRGKQVMKHTCGSESIPKKRLQKIRETGQAVEELDLFVDTHTSKKTNTFIDEPSRVAAESMKELVRQHTDENGSCNISEREALTQVLGPGKKGRERMMGKAVGTKIGRKTISEEVMARALEEIRRENAENMARAVEAVRLEGVANMQAAIQAMIASGQLMVPQTRPSQDSEARQHEVNEEDNTRG